MFRSIERPCLKQNMMEMIEQDAQWFPLAERKRERERTETVRQAEAEREQTDIKNLKRRSNQECNSPKDQGRKGSRFQTMDGGVVLGSEDQRT